MSKLAIVAVYSVILLCACGPTAETQPKSEPAAAISIDTPKNAQQELPPILIDQSSPDRALKTHFAFQDRYEYIQSKRYNEEQGKSAEKIGIEAAEVLFDGAAKRYFDRQIGKNKTPLLLEKYEREILKIDNESETRAIALVNIKNVTPIPSGAEPDEYDKKRRADGVVYRYIFSKAAEGWKIEDVQHLEYSIEKKRDEWTRVMEISILIKDKPSTPSLTRPLYGF